MAHLFHFYLDDTVHSIDFLLYITYESRDWNARNLFPVVSGMVFNFSSRCEY